VLLRLHILAQLAPELFNQLPGAVAQMRWNFYGDLDQLIAAARPHPVGKALATHAQNCA